MVTQANGTGRRLLTAGLCALLSLMPCFSFCAPGSQDEFHPARVKDISDRAYEPAVIELLDSARHSIVLSMYYVTPLEEGPVRLLMRDLEEALERGVGVEMYMNTKFKPGQADDVATEEPFNRLREKGARIYTVTPVHRLHDKLIIVDERYVVEGSVNWSISAIKNNFESAVLIDSPELAKEKLLRLRRLPLEGQGEGDVGRPDRRKKRAALPEGSSVALSKSLLEDGSLFPEMLTRHDSRSMDAYLLLLAEAACWKAKEFFLAMETMAVDLKMPGEWDDTALRRQMIKTLNKLKDRYKLIDVDFRHGQDAWVVLKALPGDTFELKGDFFGPDFLASRSQVGKFVLLVKALLEQEGRTIDSFTQEEICARFHISKSALINGLKEIEAGSGSEIKHPPN